MRVRLALAAVAATVADAVYGFVVYGNVLNTQFSAFPAVFRPAETGPIGPGVAVGMALAGLGEWLLIGAVIGAVYKPAGLPSRATV
jgi:hypothetical protein